MKEYLGDGYEMEQAEMAQEAISGGQVQDGAALRHEGDRGDDGGSPNSDDVRGATPARGPLEIDLPFPPSTNSLWTVRFGKLRLSADYKRWIKAADKIFLTQKRKCKAVKGHFEVFAVFDEKQRTKRNDLDNLCKATLDILQRYNLIENDALADTVCLRWGYAPEGCRLQVWPR